ncbi:MAG: ABC transporter permease, partial [Bacteroidales bacterium]
MVKVPIKRGRATKLSENFRVSLRSIAGTKLRSTLTIAIIAIGITSLVGILTTTEAITGVMKSSFGKMGSLSFSLTSLRSLPPLNMGRRINKRAIKYNQAQLFTESFESSSLVTIYTRAAVNIALESENATSNPTFSIWAVDENYLQFMAISIAQGRYFNSNDFERGLSYAVVGANVAKALFKRGEALGSIVRYGSFKFRIIGVLEPIGETFGGSVDSQVWLTIPYARATLLRDIAGYSIGIQPNDNSEDAMVEAEQLLRSIRRLRPTDKTDFRIVKANAFLEDLEGVLSYVTIAAFIVGVITLLGATVGLMNIMLVSVKE